MSIESQAPLGDQLTEGLRQLGKRWSHLLAAGIVLIALGTLAIVFSFFGLTHRIVGAGWVLLNGILSLILGTWILVRWPWEFWIVGLFVGIDMVFLGWSWVMLGAAVKPTKSQTM